MALSRVLAIKPIIKMVSLIVSDKHLTFASNFNLTCFLLKSSVGVTVAVVLCVSCVIGDRLD